MPPIPAPAPPPVPGSPPVPDVVAAELADAVDDEPPDPPLVEADVDGEPDPLFVVTAPEPPAPVPSLPPPHATSAAPNNQHHRAFPKSWSCIERLLADVHVVATATV
jgi:hypothetical protein